MQLKLEQKQSKSHTILTTIEAAIETGRLSGGSKLQSMRAFSKQFSVSVATVQYAFNKLETKGLIESRPGAGVFVKSKEENIVDREITFLIPYSNFFMVSDQSGVMARRQYTGMCNSSSFKNVKLLPVSQDATITLETIDYQALEKIKPRAQVVINGNWYSKLFPFFSERKINGILIGAQDNYELAAHHGYSLVLANYSGAIEDSVCYLSDLGYKRIAVLKCGGAEENSPFMTGYLNGLKHSSLDYDPVLIKTFPTKKMFPHINYQYFKEIISDLWQRSSFDALLLSIPDISTIAVAILQHDLGLRIPNDVAVMALHDRMEHINSNLPVTAVEFPWYDMGAECVRLFEKKRFVLGETKFNATIVERESTKKGAGAFVNTKLLPEYNKLKT